MDTATSRDRTSQPIAREERSGVLHPENLRRYNAQWFEPAVGVRDVVESYWSVTWNLPPEESIVQRIIAAPAVTLSLESGSVPAPIVVTGVHRGAWEREIRGAGSAFGIRLRPAGLGVLSDLTPARIADVTVPSSASLDVLLHDVLTRIAGSPTAAGLATAADRVIAHARARRRPGRSAMLANEVVAHLTASVVPERSGELASRFGVSERSIQRALRTTIGHGPKWIARWTRLQEVARVLSLRPESEMAAIALELGYTDQAHLINDFRSAVGMTPGAYVRSLRSAVQGSGETP
jgi:AraC-like DNA-binding protein